MHIHFVCEGNVYRSRMAEAYLRSKQIPNVTVSSSGTRATANIPIIGPVSWEAMRILKNNQLVPFLKPTQTQTTIDLLNNADKVIFIGSNNYEKAKNELGFAKNTYEIWEIADIMDIPRDRHEFDDEIRRMKLSEEAFEKIKQNVDTLCEHLHEK